MAYTDEQQRDYANQNKGAIASGIHREIPANDSPAPAPTVDTSAIDNNTDISDEEKASQKEQAQQQNDDSYNTMNQPTKVRDWMTSNGFDNGSIGYNAMTDNSGKGTVTYGNKDFIGTTYNNGGNTYASRSDLQASADAYMTGKGFTGARSALNSMGIDDNRIGWNPATKMIQIDSEDKISPTAVIDGKAYISNGSIPNTVGVPSGDVGVRNYVTSLGLNPNKLNQSSDGNVTYDGYAIVNPNRNIDGTTYAYSNDIVNGLKNIQGNYGYMSTRDGLTKLGISANRIGWNAQTGMVTIDGKDAVKPKANIDGTSYLDESDFNNIYSKESGGKDSIVKVTDYVPYSQQVQWSNGILTVGGRQVPVFQVIDGKAYAKRSDVDAAINNFEKQNNVRNMNDVYGDYSKTYAQPALKDYNNVLNRDKWSYNTDTDPAYQAYKNQYLNNANQYMKDAMAASRNFGGSVSSTAAAQAYVNQLNRLNNVVPQLEQQSFNRYNTENNTDLNTISGIRNLGYQDFTNEYNANNNQRNYLDKAAEQAYERTQTAKYTNPQQQANIEYLQMRNQYYEPQMESTLRQSNIKEQAMLESVKAQQLSNQFNLDNNNALQITRAISAAQNGSFSQKYADALGLTLDIASDGKPAYFYSNGEMYNPFEYTIASNDIKRDQALWTAAFNGGSITNPYVDNGTTDTSTDTGADTSTEDDTEQ